MPGFGLAGPSHWVRGQTPSIARLSLNAALLAVCVLLAQIAVIEAMPDFAPATQPWLARTVLNGLVFLGLGVTTTWGFLPSFLGYLGISAQLRWAYQDSQWAGPWECYLFTGFLLRIPLAVIADRWAQRLKAWPAKLAYFGGTGVLAILAWPGLSPINYSPAFYGEYAADLPFAVNAEFSSPLRFRLHVDSSAPSLPLLAVDFVDVTLHTNDGHTRKISPWHRMLPDRAGEKHGLSIDYPFDMIGKIGQVTGVLYLTAYGAPEGVNCAMDTSNIHCLHALPGPDLVTMQGVEVPNQPPSLRGSTRSITPFNSLPSLSALDSIRAFRYPSDKAVTVTAWRRTGRYRVPFAFYPSDVAGASAALR